MRNLVSIQLEKQSVSPSRLSSDAWRYTGSKNKASGLDRKLLFIFSIIYLLTSNCHSQGLINFDFRHEIRLPDGFTLAKGTNYWAELLAGTQDSPPSTWKPVGSPVPLNQNGRAIGGIRAIPDIPPGKNATVAVRVWDTQGGGILNFENARIRGQSSSYTFMLAHADGPQAIDYPPPGLAFLSAVTLGYFIRPDPCDCHLYPIFEDRRGIGFGQTSSLIGLSGDGRTALFSSSSYSGSPAGYSFSDSHMLASRETLWPTILVTSDRFQPYTPIPPSAVTAPITWRINGLSDDGQRFAGTQTSNGVNRAVLIRRSDHQVLPMATGDQISGNGRFIFGRTAAAAWSRFDTLGFSSIPMETGAEALLKKEILCTTQNGDRALFQRSDGSASGVLWSENVGWISLPDNFMPRAISGDGGVVVGQFKTNGVIYPATWSISEGVRALVKLGTNSFIQSISADGLLLAGYARTNGGYRIQVWNREGSAFGLAELVRGVDLSLVETANFVPEIDKVELNADGSALAFSLSSAVEPDRRFAFLSAIAMPADSRGRMQIVGGENPSVLWIGKQGYSYQLQISPDLETWSDSGTPIEGSNLLVQKPVTGGGTPIFFRFLRNLSPSRD